MKAYFANGLFSQADFDFNAKLVARLREEFPKLDIYLPRKMPRLTTNRLMPIPK